MLTEWQTVHAHAQTPIEITDMHFSLKLPQDPYYISANSKGSGESAFMPERLLVAYVVSTLFSFADSFYV